MNLAFYGENIGSGCSTFRVRHPSHWINRYTEHQATYYPIEAASEYGHKDVFHKYDGFVFHKQIPMFNQFAKYIREKYPDKFIVFDTDDLDSMRFTDFYLEVFFTKLETEPETLFHDGHGVTVGSVPLLKWYSHKPAAVIENGFDTNLSIFRKPEREQYFNDQIKIVYMGGGSHKRDLEMLLRLEVLQQICSEYPVDIWIYGIVRSAKGVGMISDVPYGKGSIYTRAGTRVDRYPADLLKTASLVIAPLIQDTFNGHRSTLKLVEAGLMGLPVVASNVETYRQYKGQHGIQLVDNDADSWYKALVLMIEDEKRRDSMGEYNRACVEQYYSAEYLTDQRIAFYNRVRESL